MAKLLVANWKMNPASEAEAGRLARGIDSKNIVICPPFPFLAAVRKIIKKAKLGAQDVFWEHKGAYTGEVSAAMLKNLGAEYVIIGHSERRRWLHETDEMINKKISTALKTGLTVILCVGESLAIRRRGLTAAKRFVKNQLQKNLKNVSSFKFPRSIPPRRELRGRRDSKLLVAYEPIWAIGTGRADKPEDTVAMARFIKKFLHSTFYILHSPVLYGGSVNGANALGFLINKEIDGALVGGASLKSEEFRKIIKISSHL